MFYQIRPYAKKLAILIIIGCTLYSVYAVYYLRKNSRPADPLVEQIIQGADAIRPPARETSQSAAVSTTYTEVESSHSAPNFTPMTAAEHGELIGWTNERGYFSEGEMTTYKNYADATLETLAKDGDIRALYALGSKHIAEGNSEKAIPYYWEAAALGATTVLDSLGMFAMPNFTNDQNEQTRKAATMESLAIYKTAVLRGDIRISTTGIKYVKTTYENRYGELKLSQEELQQIDQRALEIYNRLQARRHELGLGDFENSTPRAIKEFFDSKR